MSDTTTMGPAKTEWACPRCHVTAYGARQPQCPGCKRHMMKTNSTTTSDYTFTIDVLRVFAEFDSCDDVWWRTDEEYAPVTFLVNCNDVFFWGTADCEQVTAENLALLRSTYAECEALGCVWCASRLFCARVRKMRPQGAAYPEERKVWALFDACGPQREIGMGNPQKHPSQRE